jgi:glycosyltransferase involved in cell wall biosynthesis
VRPSISVVMSVYNGGARLQATLDSMFAQTFDDFELIVVDDGSTDATAEILRRCGDARLRVLTQENRGLTRALIRGCEEARGPVIARQDCGDRSQPERLARQLGILDAEPDVVLVSCHTRYEAPGGETLYVATGDGERVRQSLLNDGVDSIRGLSHHGSAMFRSDTYRKVGGYRPEFRVAQDLDLWVRMAPLGHIVFVPAVLYEATIDSTAISARHRLEQLDAARIVLQLRDGGDPATLLEQAAAVRSPSRRSARRAEADTLYFIASCLRKRRDPHWIRYAGTAIRRNPLLMRAWLLFVRRGQ